MPEYTITKALSAFAAGPIAVGDAEWRWATAVVAGSVAAGDSQTASPSALIGGVAQRLGGDTAEATVWKGGDLRQAEWAAFVNASAVYGDGAEDKNTADGMNIGAVVTPVAIASGELAHSTAADIVEAALVGAEVAMRVADALGQSHGRRGWHLLGTAGVVGAAAAAARLLRLSPDQTEQCLGLGATQAAGLQAQLGTSAYGLQPAKAAFNGLEAARLIKAGLDGPRAILEGRRGLFALASDDPDPARATEGLGQEWRVQANISGGNAKKKTALDAMLSDRTSAGTMPAAALLGRH